MDSDATLYICRPQYFTIMQGTRMCRVCKVNRRFVDTYEGWYGTTITCLTCGNAWNDGYMRRAGKRNRAEIIKRARALLTNRTESQHPKNFKKALRASL